MPRIIDGIPLEDDRAVVPLDWEFLLTPLLETLKLKVKDAPELYVPPGKPRISHHTLLFDRDLTAAVPSSKDKIITYFRYPRPKPVVLLGRTGVGKSSWLHYVLHCIGGDETIASIYYDQKIEEGNPQHNTRLTDFENLRLYILARVLDRVLLFACDLPGAPAHAYSVQQIESGNLTSVREFCEALEATLKLISPKYKVVVMIDNLDRYEAEFQKQTFQFAVWLASLDGLKILLPLRPETYNQDFIQKRRIELEPMPIYAPSIIAILQNRLEFLFEDRNEWYVSDILERLSAGKERLKLATAELVYGSYKEGLRTFYNELIHALGQDAVLESLLLSLHVGNVERTLAVLPYLIRSKGIYSEYQDAVIHRHDTAGESYKDSDVESAEWPRFLKSEKLVTAYLRGPYEHYRGRSTDYPVVDINIFDLPAVGRSEILVGLRLLQILRSASHLEGMPFLSISSICQSVGYSKKAVETGVRFLAMERFIFDTERQLEWKMTTPVAEDDTFIINSAGVYLLESLLGTYAFRFAEAVSDTTDKARIPDGDIGDKKGLLARTHNAFRIAEMIVSALQMEQETLAGVDPRFLADSINTYCVYFLPRGIANKGVVERFCEQIRGMAFILKKLVSKRGFDNYQESNAWESLMPNIQRLEDRAKRYENIQDLSARVEALRDTKTKGV